MKPLSLRTSLTLVYTGILALLMTALVIGDHSTLVRQLEDDATAALEEKARGLHGYLQFTNGSPELAYNSDDAEATAFIDDATDYYQVYDGRDGRLLTQSPGLEALGLHFTPDEVAEFRKHPSPRDVQTDRGRLRLTTTVISPTPQEIYVVQVGDSLDALDRTLTTFDRLLVWRVLAALALAAVVGRWLAGRALAPLTRLAGDAQSVDVARLDSRLPVRGAHDELDLVTHAFNDALARIERSVLEMRQFSAAVAHELRTPLAILRGEAELALRSSASDEARRQTLARQIDEYDRLTRLINQILTLARAESGEITLAGDPIDLAALAASVTDQIEPVASAAGITVTCEGTGPVIVTGDAGWLERLLLILLDNAIKFTPSGGWITVTCARTDGTASVAVADSGPGIPSDALPHLFERFYRADPDRARDTQGAGLGLALAKWIADRHHATITVKSRVGEGARFAITFPVRTADRSSS